MRFAYVPLTSVAKKFVVVAFVPVALTNVKFCRVLEAVAKRFANVIDEVAVRVPTVRLPIEVDARYAWLA